MVNEIDQKIEKFCKLKEWEVVFWLNEKLCEAKKEEKIEYFESITKMLPKAIILVFGVEDYRSVIFKVTDTTYERVAEGIVSRHPHERIRTREQMGIPIKDLIENKKEHIYIESAILDPRTEYMRELVINERISDIYYTRVTTPSGEWVIVVDGVGEKNIDIDKRKFLDSLGEIIQKIEEELDEIRKEMRITRCKIQSGTTTYLIGLLLHLFRNKMMSIGGLCRILYKTAATNGDNGSCYKCKEKSQIVLTETQKIEDIFKHFDEAINDIKKAAVLNIEQIPICEIVKDVIDIHRDTLVEVEPMMDNHLIATDRRKSVKAICRVIDYIIRQNKKPVMLSIERQKEFIKLILKQENIDTLNLQKIIDSPGSDRMFNHSLFDFRVIISSILLPEMKVSLNIEKRYIELLFPQI